MAIRVNLVDKTLANEIEEYYLYLNFKQEKWHS